MKNWKTNLGGAISITGTSLLGVGLLVSPDSLTPTELKGFILAGLICSALGKGVTALFAADATQVKALTERVTEVEETKKDK